MSADQCDPTTQHTVHSHVWLGDGSFQVGEEGIDGVVLQSWLWGDYGALTSGQLLVGIRCKQIKHICFSDQPNRRTLPTLMALPLASLGFPPTHGSRREWERMCLTGTRFPPHGTAITGDWGSCLHQRLKGYGLNTWLICGSANVTGVGCLHLF